MKSISVIKIPQSYRKVTSAKSLNQIYIWIKGVAKQLDLIYISDKGTAKSLNQINICFNSIVKSVDNIYNFLSEFNSPFSSYIKFLIIFKVTLSHIKSIYV